MNLRKLARGKPCMVRMFNVCNGNQETTVLAHLNGGGMGLKNPDLFGAWCCSDCHDAIDGRRYKDNTGIQITHSYTSRALLEGIIRTQRELLNLGLKEAIDGWK